MSAQPRRARSRERHSTGHAWHLSASRCVSCVCVCVLAIVRKREPGVLGSRGALHASMPGAPPSLTPSWHGGSSEPKCAWGGPGQNELRVNINKALRAHRDRGSPGRHGVDGECVVGRDCGVRPVRIRIQVFWATKHPALPDAVGQASPPSTIGHSQRLADDACGV